MPNLDGIDVSWYQNAPGGGPSTRPQWTLVHRQGLKFVAAKATQGNYRTDPEFRANWHDMHQYDDWCRIAYHFADDDVPVKTQANYFYNVAKDGFGPRDGVMLDVETARNVRPISADMTYGLLSEIQQLFQRPTMCYIGNFYPNNVDQDKRIQNYPWWLPWYRLSAPPWPRTPAIWQWDSGQSIQGIGGRTDANEVISPLVLLSACAWPAGSGPVIPPKPVEVQHMFNPPQVLSPIVDQKVPADGRGVWLLGQDGGVYTYGGAQFYGGPAGQAYWGKRQAAKFDDPNPQEAAAGKKYAVIATSGERYAFPG